MGKRSKGNASDRAAQIPGPTTAVLAPRTSIRRQIADALTLDNIDVVINATELAELETGCEPGQLDVLILAFDEACAARQAVTDLRRLFPHARMVLLTPANHDVRTAVAGFESQVDGVVHNSQLRTALSPTVRAVMAEQVVFPRNGRRRMESPPPLSHRERQVLRLAVTGSTNDQIAAKLFLSTSTVKSHLTSAFAKLDVRSRSEAAALIFNPDEPVGHLVFGPAYTRASESPEPEMAR
jgi:DNA-binding NarL/FixJ family response regulator